MLKILVVATLIAFASGSPIATPLLGTLMPQPGPAPANTEHAGYVGAVRPILRSTAYIASAPLIPSTYAINSEHQAIPYAANYLYSSPNEAAAYRIIY